ncbi:hypothetical protein L6452_37485 [Arctium lappa]|uniref:Uncharacterized protein n=1 Tax=Arctium lappa TaxID=4217 RepID=A0ACB8Y3M1_ARCLA|nr:hypothetical protein L6452_37485 [Arctium lappa]
MVKARSPKIYADKDMSTVKKMQVGVNKLVDIVGGILGPKRHDLMLMSKNGSLNTVNDGFSATKETYILRLPNSNALQGEDQTMSIVAERVWRLQIDFTDSRFLLGVSPSREIAASIL